MITVIDEELKILLRTGIGRHHLQNLIGLHIIQSQFRLQQGHGALQTTQVKLYIYIYVHRGILSCYI
jgi:hypothetical protein